jgi:type IV pilus assembly protein PilV
MKNRLQSILLGQNPSQGKQTGVALLETLIAILIFSLGILTVISIQAASVKMAADAQHRTRAVLLADQLVGQMWTSGLDIAELAEKFSSSGSENEKYDDWLNKYVKEALPDVVEGEVCPSECPDDDSGVCPTRPSVVIVPVDHGQPKARFAKVTITLCWRTPSMKTNEVRRHVVTSQITRNL